MTIFIAEEIEAIAPRTVNKDLPRDYYLTNFQSFAATITDWYGDILNHDEHLFLNRFNSLSKEARMLFVRLISRKGPHFRDDKLAYPEIGGLDEPLRELEQAELVCINATITALDCTSLLHLKELRSAPFWAEHGIAAKCMGKSRFLAYECLEDHAADLNHYCRSLFRIVTPLHTETLIRFRLLFFGTLSQDLSEFVLNDMGLTRFESYTMRPEDRFFQKREILDETLAFYQLRELIYLALEQEDWTSIETSSAMLLEASHGKHLRNRVSKLLNFLGSHMERSKRFEQALIYYGASSRHPARERQIRIHEKLEQRDQAHALCLSVLEAPWSETEQIFAERYLPRLEKKMGLRQKPGKKMTHPTDTVILERDPAHSVETHVVRYFRHSGFYAENGFWMSLFGLTFWDMIFMPVPGAFFNPFQRGPLDLFSEQFYENRKDALTKRLDFVRHSEPDSILDLWLRTKHEKQGITNALIKWHKVDDSRLTATAQGFSGSHLAEIFQRFAKHPGLHRSGFPDLILFDDSGKAELVEVKGPGDQLHDGQRRWLRFFAAKQIPYRVIRVKWSESRLDDASRP